MGTIRETTKKDGTKRYHAEIRLRGSAPQRSSHRTRTLAKKWVQDIESAIRDGRHFRTVEAKKHTVDELIDRFIEQWIPKYPARYQKKQEALLLWWKNELGHLVLSDLTTPLIAECRDRLFGGMTYRKSKRSGSTVNRYLAAFSKCLKTGVKEWQWLSENPMDKITKFAESQGRDRFLSEEEIDRLLKACQNSQNPCLFSMVKLSLLTGLRYSELINLCYEDLSFEYKTITLQQTKNGEKAIIPLTAGAAEIFRSCPSFGSPPSSKIFPPLKKRSSSSKLTIRYAFLKALKEANIEGVVWHDLRRTFCSHAAMIGSSQQELMRLMRHLSPTMTRVYARFSQGHVENLMERIQEKLMANNAN
ncbi:MAG: Tyrosine recombinase XerD [Chlamydiae bacterium]|nr:Tyrosine recombinase XerD [Chlamydiota bacterium]